MGRSGAEEIEQLLHRFDHKRLSKIESDKLALASKRNETGAMAHEGVRES